MEKGRQLRIIRRWLPLLVVGAVTFGLAAFALMSVQPRIYEAEATLKLGQPLSGAPIPVTIVSDRLLTEYAYRATTRATLDDAAASIGLDASPVDLQRQVTAAIEPSSALLTITARADSADGAAGLANAISDHLIATSSSAQGTGTIQQALIDDIDALRAEIERARAQISVLSADTDPSLAAVAQIADLEDLLVDRIAAHGAVLDRLRAIGAHELDIVSTAIAPPDFVEPRPLLFTALAVLAGLMAAAAIAVILEFFDDTLRAPGDLEEAIGLPTLGDLAELSGDAKAGGENRLVTVRDPRSTLAEEYRRLRVNLEIATESGRLHTLLVTGSEPSIGTGVVAANLAVAFAEAGRRVVLVDGNLHRPSLHTFFGLPNERGLTSMFGRTDVMPEHVFAKTGIANLDLIPRGSYDVNPSWAISVGTIQSLISQLAANYDLVIFDSPPIPTITDALVLSADLHETLLIVAQGRTHRSDVQQALDALSIAKADVLGAALFRRRRGSSRAGRDMPDATEPQKASAGALDS